ncbi:unnamed protein product [Heligmosomoides polygyrus]|uniref:Glucuronosyltransferase n=1 Tax=Heligmosomoides polygyrus TaxID=6339 RepID=A0A183FVC5_HELPZ|nr:unnamed protein product [Heligmosomoides polygyrus]
MPPPLSTALLLPLLFHSCSCQLLEIFGLSTGDAGTVERQPFHDLASQSVGLINYLQTVQRNPDNQLAKNVIWKGSVTKIVTTWKMTSELFLAMRSPDFYARAIRRLHIEQVIIILCSGLRQPLPTMNFMGGLPVVPGVLGSLPGAGACLPRGAPLVRDKSPSFFQNMIRNIPGVHDYLASLLPAPMVNIDALLGKYYWVSFTKTRIDSQETVYQGGALVHFPLAVAFFGILFVNLVYLLDHLH